MLCDLFGMSTLSVTLYIDHIVGNRPIYVVWD